MSGHAILKDTFWNALQVPTNRTRVVQRLAERWWPSEPERYFILYQKLEEDSAYRDREGREYHWTTKSSGATKQLAEARNARFVYYRPGEADDGTTMSFFGAGRIDYVKEAPPEDSVRSSSRTSPTTLGSSDPCLGTSKTLGATRIRLVR